MRNMILWIFIAVGCALTGTVQAAGDPAVGKYKFATCSGCHGIPGYTNAYPTYRVPKLGRQHAEYIIAALNAYRDGARQHPTMQANASALSEQDMADIAAYVANIPPSASRNRISGDPIAGRHKAAVCQACHGAYGSSPEPQFPHLAGQYQDYLIRALQDYQSGERQNAIMNGIAAQLSARDMIDIAAYYASQEKALVVVRE